jgi:exosortase B
MRVDAIAPDPRFQVSRSLIGSLWPLLLGLAAIVVPTMVRLARDVWTTDAGMHGIIVLATGLWLIARERQAVERLRSPASPGLFWTAAIPAVLVYIFGRAFDFLILEVAALFVLLVAIGYLYLGARAIRHLWFPILYLCFLIPLPGFVIDSVTAPLKNYISAAATELLQWFGYPIVRLGATLHIDQYQLLVEDACAGLNSLVSLTAIGLFYVYLLHRASWRYSLFLLFWIVPMGILANFVRVVALVLVTYHFGDAMAQGFLHSTAGILMFVTALAGIFVIDGLAWPLRRRLARRQAA